MMTTLLLSALLQLVAHSASAQEGVVDTQECTQAMEHAMGYEQRFYRSVIVGQQKASDAPEGSVRYDKEGKPWIKTSSSDWESYKEEEDTGDQKNNDAMDNAAEFPARRGWLEVQKADTSELLPPLLQSYRALQCRLDQVCALAATSLRTDGKGGELTITIPGCEEVKREPIEECVNTSEFETAQLTVTNVVTQCKSMRDALIVREAELLKLLVAYDSAERSLYQFLGIIDTFLTQLRQSFVDPMWQAVRAFQELGRIPCFSSQCER